MIVFQGVAAHSQMIRRPKPHASGTAGAADEQQQGRYRQASQRVTNEDKRHSEESAEQTRYPFRTSRRGQPGSDRLSLLGSGEIAAGLRDRVPLHS